MYKPFLLSVLLFFYSFANAQVLVLNENDTLNLYSLVEYASYFEDKTHKIDFDSLKKNITRFSDQFTPLINKGKNPNLDFTSSSFWLKFSIKNNSSLTREFYLQAARPLTDKANLYTISDSNRISVYENGDQITFKERLIKNRKLVFPILLAPFQQTDYFMHLKSDGESLTVPLNIWQKEAFSQNNYLENLILGFYYGILFFVFVIYFFFFVVLKDRTYLYYISFIFSLFFLQLSLDGFAFQYIWPNNTWMASHSLVLTASFSFLFIMLYTRSFLKITERKLSLNKIYKILILLALIGVISTFTSGLLYAFTYPYINILSLLGLFFVFYAIYRVRKKGFHVCPYFMPAFIFSIIGISLFILGQLSIIPQNPFTEHGLKLGSGVEVLFLSISMANKYRELQKEKEMAQNEALKKLEEMNILKDELNTELEQKVKDRTKELNEQKEILSEKNEEIVSSIRYAKRIQNAILPPDDLVNQSFSNSFILYKPKDIVAGDFYWIEPNLNTTLFAAADCTGHGVPGAMVSVVCNNALNRSVREFNLHEPGKILDKTREIVVEEFAKSNEDVKDGMDISLCKLEKKNSGKYKLEWAGANNPLWIISNANPTQLLEFKPNKQPIGKVETPTHFTTQSIELEKEDHIYLFTDGFQDQFGGEKGKKFKASKLKELLLSIHGKSMPEQKEILNAAFEKWRGNLEQVDDVCIMGIKV